MRGQSVYFTVYNRGKKSLCLDMRTERGKEIFAALVPTADIVLQNFRPGVMEKMGFGYDRLCELKPDIILCSVSGFGQYGPYRERPAFDPLGQAMSGLMSLTGKPVGQPLGAATSLVDRYTSLHATIGTLAALRHRDRTGEGQVVDCCLWIRAFRWSRSRCPTISRPGRKAARADGRPTRQGWPCRDLGLGAPDGEPADANRDRRPGRPAPRMTGRAGENNSRKQAVANWCAANTVDHVVSTLLKAEIPVAPVKTIPQAAEDPHLWEREMLVKMPDALAGEIHVPGATIKMSKTRGRVGHVPTPGEHTDEVLSALLGYDEAMLRELREAKVIG